jgi:hypothetical protein
MIVKGLLYVTESVWSRLERATLETVRMGDPLRVFFLFSKIGESRWAIDAKEVPVRLVKANSESGPVFRWKIPKERHAEFYPDKATGIRYSGTAVISKDLYEAPLGITLHYAYWLGVDFKLSSCFNISLWVPRSDSRIAYKAPYLSARQTNGEFVKCEVRVVKSLSTFFK